MNREVEEESDSEFETSEYSRQEETK